MGEIILLKKRYLFLLIIVCLFAVSAVSAEDSNITIDAQDLEKYCGGNERFEVNVYENNEPANGDVHYTINGQTYDRNVNNGTSSMNINLNSGEYQIITRYKDTEVYNNIYVIPTIYGEDLVKIYKNDSQYYAGFADTQGNSLKNTDITFNINGVFYERKTNENGIAKLNINLNPGKYILTAINPVNNEMHSNVVTVLSSIMSNDMNMKFRDGSKFEVQLYGGNGRPATAGEKVTFNINGVFYTRETDSNGIARLNINLLSGNYIITTMLNNGLMKSNVIGIAPDPLYYTIGTNPLDYNYYVNEYNRFTYDWYYSPQWDAMVRTVYDIYGNHGMEIQDSYVHYGTKYVCWQQSTGNSYILNKEGEVISVTNMGDHYVQYKEYDYNNNEIIYHNIYLPSYDAEITAEIDGCTVNVHQWRTPSYCEVDIIAYDKNGKMLDLYGYDTMIFDGSKWYGPYDQSANYFVATYHKWHREPNTGITQVAVKIKNYAPH